MEQDAAKLIQQRLAELPGDVRNAVQSADLSKKIQAVGTKHNLHIDQMGELEDEVLLAMLGFSPLAQLGGRLSRALRLPPEEGEKLAADIATEVFGPIRESMKRFVDERAQKAAPRPKESQAPVAVNVPVSAPAPAPAPSTPVPPKPQPVPDLHKADVMLTQKTLDVPHPPPKEASSAPAPTPIYKADPYREPV